MLPLAAATILLIAASAPSDPTAAPRESYASCMRTFMVKSLEAKKDAATYKSEAAIACETQEKAFSDAIIKDDKANGMKQAEAEDDAKSQITDYRDKFQNQFEDYSATNTRPS